MVYGFLNNQCVIKKSNNTPTKLVIGGSETYMTPLDYSPICIRLLHCWERNKVTSFMYVIPIHLTTGPYYLVTSAKVKVVVKFLIIVVYLYLFLMAFVSVLSLS